MGYTLLWETRGVVLRFFGRITINDLLSASNAYEGDSRFDDLIYVIADYSQIDRCDAKPAEIENVWAVDYGAKMTNNKIKKAIVTTNPDIIAMARCYVAAPFPAFTIKVFATETDARAWLTA